MRTRLGFLMLAALAGSAGADAHIRSFIPHFAREAEGCAVQSSGLTKVATGAAALAKAADAGEKAELERDAEKLGAAATLVKEYCDEVGAMLAYLNANADAPYRSVEREIDTRDNKVRKLRTDAKKQLEDTQPITKKLIPRIAARRTVQIEERTTPGAFPSRRTIELPSLPGSWKLSGSSTTDTVEYTDKTARATITARPFSAATCEQQKKAITGRSDAADLLDVGVPGDSGIAWGLRYVRREPKADPKSGHLIVAMCLPTKTGGILVTADLTPPDQTTLATDLGKVMLRMLAAQQKP